MPAQQKKTFHQHIGPNLKGRDFFLGDLHGRLDALILAMGENSFNPKCDRIIAVGDLIDRGHNSYDILKLTREPWFYSVRGNHEAMLLESNDNSSFKQWLENGGEWFFEMAGDAIIDSFGLALNLPTALSVETPDGAIIGVCHAEWTQEDWANVEKHLDDPVIANSMIWGRTVVSAKTCRWDKTAALTIHGHSFVEEITKLGTALFIDTGCIFNGKLSMIDREDALRWPDA
ncbi:MAG: metallophosphoesterase [Kordiimonadaceae bacterium]|nr:metallophosphoesterase [Kordiimonadaceae bacterium]